MAVSCTLTGPPIVTRREERTRACASTIVTSTSSPQPKK